jgi:hypothetical protein
MPTENEHVGEIVLEQWFQNRNRCESKVEKVAKEKS